MQLQKVVLILPKIVHVQKFNSDNAVPLPLLSSSARSILM